MACILALFHGPAMAGRFESFTEKAAQGPKMRVVAATYFGGDGIEEFVAAGALPNGTIVAFGNTWGPQFSNQPPPLVLGKGEHHKLDPFLPDPGEKKPRPRTPREDDPDVAGMVVFYGSRLEAVKKVVRFDWGVASLSTGIVARDGSALYIAGRCTPAFRTAVPAALRADPAAGEGASGPYAYGSVQCAGDVFIAKLPASGDGVLWAIVFPGARSPADRLWLDYAGNLYADVRGLVRIAPNGRSVVRIETLSDSADPRLRVRTLTATRSAEYLGIDPENGGFYYGGNRPTNTGFQSWRQPYLYRFEADGRRAWKMWDWPPPQCACGGEGNGLCADSSVRTMALAPDGTLVVGGWSAAGNSVLTRQPTDLDQPAPFKGFGMDSSGMKDGGSIAHLLRIDPATQKLVDGTLFEAYVPMSVKSARQRGTPSPTKIETIAVSDSGAVAFTGTAASGLVRTPNAFYAYPPDGSGSDGQYVAVFTKDFQTLLFSSYLPGCQHASVATFGNKVIVTSRSSGSDGRPTPTASPAVNAAQPKIRGEYDGHIVLLEEPD
jgi:hypothetical protein